MKFVYNYLQEISKKNVIKTENVTKNRTAEKKKSSSNLEVKRPRTPPPAPKEIKGKISSTPLKEKNTELVTENPLKSNEKINKNHQKHRNHHKNHKKNNENKNQP